MAKQVQLRRGDASDHATFTGAIGELTYVSDDKTLRIHDGSTAGGVKVIGENSGILLTEKSADPSDPAEGNTVIWQSDGTGSGDDGDIMLKITAGSVTKTITLVDYSAS